MSAVAKLKVNRIGGD